MRGARVVAIDKILSRICNTSLILCEVWNSGAESAVIRVVAGVVARRCRRRCRSVGLPLLRALVLASPVAPDAAAQEVRLALAPLQRVLVVGVGLLSVLSEGLKNYVEYM